MRVIAVANQKGGCGKTTTSINFAAALTLLQKKVLLIDLDPQGHSTCGLGMEASQAKATLYDLLTPSRFSDLSFEDALCEIEPNFFLIPSYEVLASLEEELVNVKDREKMLKQALGRFRHGDKEFDCIILDCPPNLGLLTANALQAADEILIPVEPSFFSLHGLAKISETLAGVNRSREIPIEIHALLTIFDSRTRFAKEVYEEVKAHFQEKLFKTIIHESILLKEAAGAGQSIVQYDRDSSAFRDYFNLAVEYLERQWDRRLPAQKIGWQQIWHSRFGPRQVVGGILFQMQSKNARAVEIAGDFNNWVPEPLVLREPETGLWQKVVAITEGAFRYKFIVDGEWQVDPYLPVSQPNAFGTVDSYLELQK